MCDAPARVWDIVGKGRLEAGYDADLVLVDMNKTSTIQNDQQETKSRWSPWHGVSLTGWPVRTWVLGQEVFRAARGQNDSGKIDSEIRGREATFDHARGGYWATANS
jgi:dihydroorotase